MLVWEVNVRDHYYQAGIKFRKPLGTFDEKNLLAWWPHDIFNTGVFNEFIYIENVSPILHTKLHLLDRVFTNQDYATCCVEGSTILNLIRYIML